MSEERRTALCAEERGEECGEVGLAGVTGRDMLPRSALGKTARMRVLASCKLRSSVWLGMAFIDQKERVGERRKSIVGKKVCRSKACTTSMDGCDEGKTSGEARENAARAKRKVGDRPNSRSDGRGKGVDGDEESMMREK